MEKTWIRRDQVSCLVAYESNHAYYLKVFLNSGQEVTLNFDSENLQKKAYEEFKPKGE